MSNQQRADRRRAIQWNRWAVWILPGIVAGMLVCGMLLAKGSATNKVQNKCSRAEIILKNDAVMEISFFAEQQTQPYQKVRCTKEKPHRVLEKGIYNSQGAFFEKQTLSTKQDLDYDWIKQENPAQVVWKSARGDLLQKEQYTYHASGQPLQCIIHDERGNEQTQTWTYDKQDRVVCKTEAVEGAVHETNYTYEPKSGKPAMIQISTVDGRKVQKYNAEGQVSQEWDYTPDGKLYGSSQYSYNAAGRVVNQSCYDAEGGIQQTTINEYDADFCMKRSTQYAADKNSVVITEYNLIGGIECAVYIEKYESGTLQQLCINEYNLEGVRCKSSVTENDILKETLYDSSGQIIEYIEYEISNQRVLRHEVNHN